MDILPTGLCDLLRRIEMDNTISSWRIQGGYDLVLTVRFQSKVNTSMATPRHAPINTMDTFYRSKPPSSRVRDINRQQAYFDQKNTFSTKSDSGFHDKGLFNGANYVETSPTTDYSSIPINTPSEMSSGVDDKHNVPSFSINTDEVAHIAATQGDHNGPHVGAQPLKYHTIPSMTSTPQHTTCIAIQTDTVTLNEHSAQTSKSGIPSMKNRRIQTAHVDQEHAGIQTLKVRQRHELSQTDVSTRNVQSNTEVVGQIDSSIATDTCETTERHMQTFLSTKCKSTQYKHQNYQDNTQIPPPPPQAAQQENKTNTVQPESDDGSSAKIDFILEKLKLIDKLEETAIQCSDLEKITASFCERVT